MYDVLGAPRCKKNSVYCLHDYPGMACLFQFPKLRSFWKRTNRNLVGATNASWSDAHEMLETGPTELTSLGTTLLAVLREHGRILGARDS